MSTYAVKISRSADIRSILSATAGIYRKALDFFIGVCDREWDVISPRKMQTEKVNAIESFTVKTSKRPVVPYDFGKDFYKFPSYLRKAAISEAIGKVSSYRSNLKNWETEDPRTRGRRPGYPKAGYVYPAMYRDNMFVRTGTYTASIKVFTRGTWDWLDVELCKGDVDYILHHCGSRKECVPTLQRRGKLWYLDFSFKEDIKLPDRHCLPERILAVDLGINSACTCSVMEAAAITKEDVAALKEIHEYSVSTGEETGAPLCCPVKILRLTFDFMDENGNGTSVDCTGLDAVKNYGFADKEPVLPNADGEVMEEGPAKAAEEADPYILIRVSDDELPEFLGQVIDVVDDFLEERDITLPDSEKEMEEDGDDGNSAVIYGSDYGQLYEQFEELFRNWADSRPE